MTEQHGSGGEGGEKEERAPQSFSFGFAQKGWDSARLGGMEVQQCTGPTAPLERRAPPGCHVLRVNAVVGYRGGKRAEERTKK